MAAQFVRKCYQAVVAVVAVLCRRNVFEVVRGNGGNVDGDGKHLHSQSWLLSVVIVRLEVYLIVVKGEKGARGVPGTWIGRSLDWQIDIDWVCRYWGFWGFRVHCGVRGITPTQAHR